MIKPMSDKWNAEREIFVLISFSDCFANFSSALKQQLQLLLQSSSAATAAAAVAKATLYNNHNSQHRNHHTFKPIFNE